MSEIVQLNDTPIQVKDDEFATGWQVGYLDYKTNYQKKVALTEELLCTILANTFIDVQHTSRCNVGYLIGFVSALIETEPKRRFQIVGKISTEETTPVSEIGGEQL
jgi:hypothetical protein